MIALITHRYAQDGSRGAYDLYRPIDPGPLVATDLMFPDRLRVVGYHLAPSPGRPAYHGGETALLTLEWRHQPQGRAPEEQSDYHVVVQLRDRQGQVIVETTRPLVYGALHPMDWGDDVVQHMQPVALPPELPAGSYQLAVMLRVGERDLAPAQVLAPLMVERQAGRLLGEQGYYVPAPLLDTWREAGGDEGPGDPLMPATPFSGYTLQCFARACLRLRGDTAERLPLGELVRLADAGLREAPNAAQADQAGATVVHFSETRQALQGAFLAYWREHGGEDALGPPITPELVRGDRVVQYTRYARLERPIEGGAVRLARLGEEFLRLPGGVPYRWP
jgi:hypothetical protein